MTFEEWWDRLEGCGATPDTYKGWEKSCHAAWKAGVASRDAEVAELRNEVDILRNAIQWIKNYGGADELAIGVAEKALSATKHHDRS